MASAARSWSAFACRAALSSVTTPWGEASVKVATLPDGSERAAPEYEDCARLAREHGVPLQRVMQAAQSRGSAI